MVMFKRKFRAILDIIRNDKFLLVTFTDDNKFYWLTEYNITRDECIKRIE
jgi:hypothetical protein